MAKSKSGGTRSYLRGRVGADVYSVGRDAAGKKQQVVRSLAETVANPQTESQMRGRMIMSTVMQAVAAMSPIVDHSFDNRPVGQPNISEFIKRNYQLIKADVAANPASGNAFGLNMYQEKGVKKGTYIVSAGEVLIPAAFSLLEGQIKIQGLAQTATIADLKSLLGFADNDYFTYVWIDGIGKFHYNRFNINPALAGTATITASVASLFLFEGTDQPTVAFTEGEDTWELTFGYTEVGDSDGIIVSKKVLSGYKHNTCTLAASIDPAYSADIALPTYPVGTELFLNGGDI